MKIAACLGVKDEVDLVRAAIDHLRAIGVDHIIASDAHSTDGTEVILADFARGPGFEVAAFDDLTMDAAEEEAATADIFDRARAAGADWLLFCDADEFYLPRGGRLRDVAALARADALIVPRYNVPLLDGGPRLPHGPAALWADQVLVYAPDGDRSQTQLRVRQDGAAPWIASVPGPKLMARTATVSSTAEAHHDIVARDGGKVITAVPADLFIAHVPFSTASRFDRKVQNIRTVVAANGTAWGPDSAWHWRRWLDNVDSRGGVAGEMARNLVTAAELAELRRLGVVKSARQVWDRLA